MDMRFKKGDYILANDDIREFATLLTGIVMNVRCDTLNAYRISWINKSCEYWSSSDFIDKHYSKVSKEVAIGHFN